MAKKKSAEGYTTEMTCIGVNELLSEGLNYQRKVFHSRFAIIYDSQGPLPPCRGEISIETDKNTAFSVGKKYSITIKEG